MFIKPYTKKLLKDLENPDLWVNELFTVRNKEHDFEVWNSALSSSLIFHHEEIKFNLLERILVSIKVRKLKDYFYKKTMEKTPKIKYFQ